MPLCEKITNEILNLNSNDNEKRNLEKDHSDHHHDSHRHQFNNPRAELHELLTILTQRRYSQYFHTEAQSFVEIILSSSLCPLCLCERKKLGVSKILTIICVK